MKKLILSFLISLFLIGSSFAAGSDDGGSGAKKSKYDQAVKFIKIAEKNEKKGKDDKAQSNYKKAQKILLKLNKEKPNKPNVLNYLGFTSRKLGDFEEGERYYLQGLAIEPDHIGINEYLGELYVATNRHNLAIERLEVLKSCKCKEYDQLKAIIAGEKVSKY